MVAPARPVAATVIVVEPATDGVTGGGVDAEQPTTANKIVASTSGSPSRSQADVERLRHTGSLPSTASENVALPGESGLSTEAYVRSVLPRLASVTAGSDRLEL